METNLVPCCVQRVASLRRSCGHPKGAYVQLAPQRNETRKGGAPILFRYSAPSGGQLWMRGTCVGARDLGGLVDSSGGFLNQIDLRSGDGRGGDERAVLGADQRQVALSHIGAVLGSLELSLETANLGDTLL